MKNEAKLLNGCRFPLPFVLSNVQRKSGTRKKQKNRKERGKITKILGERGPNEMAKQIVLVRMCVVCAGHIATD